LSLKVLAGGSAYVAAKPLIALSLAKLGSKVSAKFASVAAGKVAAKTGGAVAAQFGTQLIDPIVAVRILLWDIWDYSNTVAEDRPRLRQVLLEYLQTVKQSLLTSQDTGVQKC
jgi:hypothetical protein